MCAGNAVELKLTSFKKQTVTAHTAYIIVSFGQFAGKPPMHMTLLLVHASARVRGGWLIANTALLWPVLR